MQDNKETFKELFDRIEEIVNLLSDKDLSLQESFELAEEGIQIIKKLKIFLHSGKGKISKIRVINGKVLIEPFI